MAMNHNLNADDLYKLLHTIEAPQRAIFKGLKLDLSAVTSQAPSPEPPFSATQMHQAALQLRQIEEQAAIRQRRDSDTVDATRRLESAVCALHDQIGRLCGLLETLQLSVVGKRTDD